MTLAITKDFDQGECPPAYVETLLRAADGLPQRRSR
jgi:2'-5' RNA ligase